MTVVVPTGRRKSVCNRCENQRSCIVFVLLTMHCLSFKGVCHTTASDLYPLLFVNNSMVRKRVH